MAVAGAIDNDAQGILTVASSTFTGNIARAGNGGSGARFADDEPAHVVAEPAVELGPAAPSRELAELRQTGGIPGLGQQLGAGQHRVLRDVLD